MLRLCHVGFDFRYISFQRGMQLTPEFRALSSWSQVPAYLVGHAASIADLCCYADIAFARLSNRGIESWPNITSWAGEIETLPAFAAPFDLLTMQDAWIAPAPGPL